MLLKVPLKITPKKHKIGKNLTNYMKGLYAENYKQDLNTEKYSTHKLEDLILLICHFSPTYF